MKAKAAGAGKIRFFDGPIPDVAENPDNSWTLQRRDDSNSTWCSCNRRQIRDNVCGVPIYGFKMVPA